MRKTNNFRCNPYSDSVRSAEFLLFIYFLRQSGTSFRAKIRFLSSLKKPQQEGRTPGKKRRRFFSSAGYFDCGIAQTRRKLFAYTEKNILAVPAKWKIANI
jgi:hypothetical protein